MSLPPIPPYPEGAKTLSDFGTHIMQWRTGYQAAVDRCDTITLPWLEGHRFTLQMASEWLPFYQAEFKAHPHNDSAKGRIILMEKCIALLKGQDNG